MKKYCIIVAGGIGQRMLSEIPKQFRLLAGKPILLHSLEAFAAAVPDLEIILVLPKAHIVTWEEIIIHHQVETRHTIAIGGDTRFQSVKNGILCITLPGLVAIHDGVRPLITKAGIVRLFAEAEKFGSAIPVTPINDTVRQTEGNLNRVIDRSHLHLVQTPEIFHSDILTKAYEILELASYTDVTSVVENSGFPEVHLCEGEIENIKITWPVDFLLAEAILKQREED